MCAQMHFLSLPMLMKNTAIIEQHNTVHQLTEGARTKTPITISCLHGY